MLRMSPSHLVVAASCVALATACSKGVSDDDKKNKPPAAAPAAPAASAPRTPGSAGPLPPGTTTMPPGHPPMGPSHGSVGGPPAPGASGQVTKLDDGRYQVGSLKLGVPDAWQAKPVTSSMRRAHFILPGGDSAPELIVYYFGAGGAGPIQANIDRWVGQFSQPDGKPSKDVAKVTNFEADGMKVTQVDVSGRYVAAMTPGADSKHNEPDFRMIASIVEAPDGAYYFKLVGPATEVEKSAADFDKAIKSIAK